MVTAAIQSMEAAVAAELQRLTGADDAAGMTSLAALCSPPSTMQMCVVNACDLLACAVLCGQALALLLAQGQCLDSHEVRDDL